jgi:hypothetical protein
MLNLDGLTFFVSATADTGVVGSDTRLRFSQVGSRVYARYAGGDVLRGWLVGRWVGERVEFTYAQREGDSTIHGGRSACDVERKSDGRIRITEHFAWTTRSGSGINVFDQVG